MVELDDTRRSILYAKTTKETTAPKKQLSLVELIPLIRKQGMFALFSYALVRMSSHFAKEVQMDMGGEFRAAFEAANETGARFVLGDRPVQVFIFFVLIHSS